MVSTEISSRFQDLNKLRFLCLGDCKKFEAFSKKLPLDAFENLKSSYPSLFDIYRLKNELEYSIYSDTVYKNGSVEQIVKIFNENDTKETCSRKPTDYLV